mgnify:CR=1 FL=1
MKILQLNVWTGRINGALLDFLRNNDFDYIKQAFWCSSRIQIDAHFEGLGLEGGTTPEEAIKDLYDNYFKINGATFLKSPSKIA